jgi:hypothetical protein
MDMIGYLGKKVDLSCKDGEKFSGYVFDILDEDDSESGCKSIELSPIDAMHLVEIAIEDIEEIKVDLRFKEFDFRR